MNTETTVKNALIFSDFLNSIAKEKRELDWKQSYDAAKKLDEFLTVKAETIIGLAHEIFGEDIAWTLRCQYQKAIHA